MADLEQYVKTFTSFSGADIQVVIGNVSIMEIQGISYSVTREKAPIYTLGSADPRSFSRGKRGIAGSMVFTIFDRNPMTALADDIRKVYYYYAKEGDLRDPANYPKELNMQMVNRNGVFLGVEKRPPIYDDQILPFDITITAANEYGNMAIKRVYGVEILNSGAGVSVDDIVNEQELLTLNPTICWDILSIRDNQQGRACHASGGNTPLRD